MDLMMRNDKEGSQMVVTVKKDELLTILQNNRKNHVAEFTAACVAYRAVVATELDRQMNALRTYTDEFARAEFDKLPNYLSLRLSLNGFPEPKSYEKHYERAIGMLQLHSKDEMTIDMTTYRNYVEDEWDWSERAKASNSSYLVS